MFWSSCSRVVLFYFFFVTFTYSIVVKKLKLTTEPFIWSYLHTLKKIFSSFSKKHFAKTLLPKKERLWNYVSCKLCKILDYKNLITRNNLWMIIHILNRITLYAFIDCPVNVVVESGDSRHITLMLCPKTMTYKHHIRFISMLCGF